MNVVCKIVVGLAGTLVVALALQLAAPKAVHAVVSHFITVDNTAANPVPITGSVNVANTANMNVTNTPSVNVANTVPVTGTVAVNSLPPVQLGGSVNVTNATDAKGNPVLVTDSDAARNSFLVSGNCSFGQASDICASTGFYTVPANTIAVLQNASGICFYSSGSSEQTTLINLTFITLTGQSNIYFSPGPTVPGFISSQPTNVFNQNLTGNYVFGPGAVSFLAASSAGDNGQGVCQFALGGYLVHQ